ncbi:DNA primase [Streptomyces sp. Act143]|uniref:DNA primase n=1 Tax=Streptomyces sp. Act143 TaxID=2200760 RepID=UPI000D6837B5|nr:DNA primase [Streptomyces sp. Act143]PWI14324.1 DNA primase [Streptomyces sp. Act143]
MNRVGLGLAVGAGYVLGRTKKLKMAFAVGTLVAGKRMQLSPRALADLVSGQLRNNPQFKEIGDQLREDLRGVGKAASGAMVERQIDALADRLHGRTAQVRDQLAGVVPDGSDLGFGKDEDDEGTDEYDENDHENEAGAEEYEESGGEPEAERDEEPEPPRERAPAKKATAKKTAAKKAPAKKSAAKAPAKKATAGTKKTAAKKTAAARGTASGARTRLPKGGGDR